MKVLIVGYGHMGHLHAKIVKRLGHVPVTVDPAGHARHTTVGNGHGCERIIIATPPAHLAETAWACLDFARPTLIEKPAAVTEADALELASHPNAGVARVGYVERHNPAVHTLARHLHLVGDLVHITARRLGPHPGRSLTTPLLDLASHDLDVIHHLGCQVRRVHTEQLGDTHAFAALRLTTPGRDATASLEASYVHPEKVRTLTVVGTQGMLTLDYQGQQVSFTSPDHSTQLPVFRAQPLLEQFRCQGGATIEDAARVLRSLAPVVTTSKGAAT